MIPLRDNIRHLRPPIVTVGLLIVNALVFVFQLSLDRPELHQFVSNYGFVPGKLFLDSPVTVKMVPLGSSLFLHGGLMHFLGNSLYLWIFADNVEDKMGHIGFLLFYLLCGVAANLAHFIMNTHSQVPAIGASGAIAGVLGAYFLMFPKAKVLTIIPFFIFWQIIEVPAVLFLGIWFLFQFLSGVSGMAGSTGVAFWAHVGGFITGIIFVLTFGRKIKLRRI